MPFLVFLLVVVFCPLAIGTVEVWALAFMEAFCYGGALWFFGTNFVAHANDPTVVTIKPRITVDNADRLQVVHEIDKDVCRILRGPGRQELSLLCGLNGRQQRCLPGADEQSQERNWIQDTALGDDRCDHDHTGRRRKSCNHQHRDDKGGHHTCHGSGKHNKLDRQCS